MLQYKINGVKLGIGIVLSTILSLSVHFVMLQGMNVPFPDLVMIPILCKFIIRVFSILGLILFWELADKKVNGSFTKKCTLLFVIYTMLTEALFRTPFMDGYCTNAIGFMFIGNVPTLLAICVTCGLVVFLVPRLNSFLIKFLAAVILAAFYIYFSRPSIGVAWKPVMSAIADLTPTEGWCKLPYGPEVLIPAYISFVEPVLACLTMAVLIWDQLPQAKWIRSLLFLLLVLAIKYELLAPVFYALFSPGSFLKNLESDGQFMLETIVLAITTGFMFEWSFKKSDSKTSQ